MVHIPITNCSKLLSGYNIIVVFTWYDCHTSMVKHLNYDTFYE